MNTEIGRDLPSHRNIALTDLRLPPLTRFGPNSLILEATPAALDLAQQDCFIGIGVATPGRPIDLVTLLLAASEMRSLTVVLVDEFAKLNGVEPELIESNVAAQQKLVRAVNQCYGVDVMTLRAGPIMATQRFAHELELVTSECLKPEFRELLMQTVPESRRRQDLDFIYSIKEIALTRIMANGLGYTTKFGPTREKSYDQLMQALHLEINFCYAIDALPVADRNPRPVVHYVSTNHGRFGAERILLESEQDVIAAQLDRASPRASAYLLKVAQRAAALRGIEIESISSDGSDLKEVMKAAVMEQIVDPLRNRI